MSRPKKTDKPRVIVNGEEQKKHATVKKATPEERAKIAKLLEAQVAPKLPR